MTFRNTLFDPADFLGDPGVTLKVAVQPDKRVRIPAGRDLTRLHFLLLCKNTAELSHDVLPLLS